jgi:hypothetical protein
MGQYAPFMYSIGLLDEKQRAYFQDMTDKATVYIRDKNFKSAFNVSAGVWLFFSAFSFCFFYLGGGSCSRAIAQIILQVRERVFI